MHCPYSMSNLFKIKMPDQICHQKLPSTFTKPGQPAPPTRPKKQPKPNRSKPNQNDQIRNQASNLCPSTHPK